MGLGYGARIITQDVGSTPQIRHDCNASSPRKSVASWSAWYAGAGARGSGVTKADISDKTELSPGVSQVSASTIQSGSRPAVAGGSVDRTYGLAACEIAGSFALTRFTEELIGRFSRISAAYLGSPFEKS
jgi:hypothetical protein